MATQLIENRAMLCMISDYWLVLVLVLVLGLVLVYLSISTHSKTAVSQALKFQKLKNNLKIDLVMIFHSPE